MDEQTFMDIYLNYLHGESSRYNVLHRQSKHQVPAKEMRILQYKTQLLVESKLATILST